MTPDLARGVVDGFFPVMVLLVVPAFVVLGWWLSKKRVERVRAWAAGVGWTYVGTDRTLVRRWNGRPFGIGSSRRVSELCVGRWDGRPAMTFRYEYTTGSGKDRSTSTFHVLALTMPAYLPMLELTPDHALQRFASAAFGAQDIQFESEDFNRAWRIRAHDERFAHAVVHPRLMERLMQPDARGTSLRLEGTEVLAWSSGSPRYDDVAARLRVMSAVVDAVPRFVWVDHGYDPGN